MKKIRHYTLIAVVALLSMGCTGRSIRKAIEAEQQHTEHNHNHDHDHDHSANNTRRGIRLSAERLNAKQAIDTIYMGRVSAGEVVTCKVVVRNEDAVAAALLTTRTTCGCVGAEFSAEPIQPKRTREVEVRFDSAGYGGRFSQNLYLTTSLSEEPLHLVIMADVR